MKLTKTILTTFFSVALFIGCGDPIAKKVDEINNNNNSNYEENSTNSDNSNSQTLAKTLYPTKIKKSGQTLSYDADGNLVTDGSIKDDGFYQAGEARDFSLNSNVVTDSVSGIDWEDTPHSSSTEVSYSKAKEYCSKLNLDSKDNWRVPTLKEFTQLINYAKRGPALDSEFKYAKYGLDSVGYWSSTKSTFRWWISLLTGNDHFYITDNNKHYVKCVNNINSNWKEANFTREDGIVKDNNSKLFWQDNTTISNKSWIEAINYCESLNLGGYSNWRLPNINELGSIIDHNSNSNLDKIFKQSTSDLYWSSTSHAAQTSIAWVINFKYGSNAYKTKDSKLSTRCVREKN